MGARSRGRALGGVRRGRRERGVRRREAIVVDEDVAVLGRFKKLWVVSSCVRGLVVFRGLQEQRLPPRVVGWDTKRVARIAQGERSGTTKRIVV